MSARVDGPWREMCETGATWTDWALTSFGPSCSSRLSRAIIMRERSPVVLHVQTLEVLPCKHRFYAFC
jgi:hypothetical protein